MVKRVQIIRHNSTDAGNFIGREGEPTINMTDDCLIVHDGETPGGVPQARADLANSPAATAAVAGKMAAVDKAKLDGIESGAEVNPDAAEIKTLYETNPDTNAFTDADLLAVRTTLPDAVSTLDADLTTAENALAAHEADTNNPHVVTKAQLGLKIINEAEALVGTNTDDAYVTAALLKSIIEKLSGHLGDHKWGYYDPNSLPDGWILGYDGTTGTSLSIGSATSGANYAGDQYQALYERIYLRVVDSDAPVSGGRSGDAAADFAANKALIIPNASGRVPLTANPQGHGAVSQRLPGRLDGAETHTLTIAQMPSHSHAPQSGDLWGNQSGGTAISGVGNGGAAEPNFISRNTQATGSGEAHNNMQPSIGFDMIIKYRN